MSERRFSLVDAEGSPVKTGAASPDGVPGLQDYADTNGLTIEWEQQHSDAANFVQGGAQGLSFGTSDEAQGMGAMLHDAVEGTEIQRLEQGIDGAPVDRSSYDVGRDDARQRLDEAYQESPKATIAGDVAGSVLASLAPIGGAGVAGKTMSTMDKARRAGKVGAAIGAAEGFTRSDADLGSHEMSRDVATGGTLGLIGGPVVGALAGTAAPRVSKRALSKHDALLEKAARLDTQADAQKLAAAGAQQPEIRKFQNQPGGVRRVVETMDKHGLGSGKRVPTKEDYHRDAARALEEVSANRSALIEGAEGGVDQRRLAERLQSEVAEPMHTAGDTARERLWRGESSKLLMQGAEELPGGGAISRQSMPLDEAQAWKGRYTDQARYQADASGGAKRTAGAYKDAARITSEEMAAGLGDKGDAWLESGTDMQGLMSIGQLEDKALRQETLRKIEPSTYGAGGAGAVVGGLTGGPVGAVQGALMAGAANKLYRPREHQLAHMVSKARAGHARNAADRTVRSADNAVDRATSRAGGMVSGAAAEAPVFATMSDKVQSLAASDPGQLGPYGASLNNALQMGRDHFVAYHSTLQQTDPGYQRLLRQLEETEHE